MEDLLPKPLSETPESLVQLDAQLPRPEREPNDEATTAAIFCHVHAMKQGREAGFDGYVSKFDGATLLDAVTEALSPEHGGRCLERRGTRS